LFIYFTYVRAYKDISLIRIEICANPKAFESFQNSGQYQKLLRVFKIAFRNSEIFEIAVEDEK